MITTSAATTAALADRRARDRDFIWFTVRNRSTGAAYSEGYHSDIGTISQDVVDPETDSTDTRTWYGSGRLIEIGPIPRVMNLTVVRVPVWINGVDDRIEDLLRTYDPKQGKVQIFKAPYDPLTGALLEDPFYRFWGWIDDVRMPTPIPGGDGRVRLDCVGTTQELTRANPALRSDSNQRLRNASDGFLRHAATAHKWVIQWGRRPSVAGTSTPGGNSSRTGPGLVGSHYE